MLPRTNPPSCHVGILVDGNVGCVYVVVGPKVAVGRPKPLIKAVLQRKVLRLLPQVPAVAQGERARGQKGGAQIVSICLC